MDEPEQTLDDILGQTAWIRGLARRLVSDAAERDDIVQEAWIETLQKGRRARALKPWLFGVVRNIARTERRRDSRRRAREEAGAPVGEPARPDELSSIRARSPRASASCSRTASPIARAFAPATSSPASTAPT